MLRDIIFIIFLTGLSGFVAYLYFFVITSLIVRMHTSNGRKNESAPRNRFGIIIPAHNEELLIGECLESAFAIEYPNDMYDVIVVADNCDDSTADITRNMGAICYERRDPSLRGKPYALNWIFTQIPLNNYDAYVIVDADTKIEKSFLLAMNSELHAGYEIIQGYLEISNPDESWLTRLMVIPGILKYKYRYIGKKVLGLSCPLMGNGMCFAREIIERYGWDALTLTENWEYYVKLLLRGHYATYSDDAYIYSQTAKSLKQGKIQRKRWLKGRFQVILMYLPALLSDFYKKRRLVTLDCCLELLLPSISMLFNYSVILFVSAGILTLVSRFSITWAYWGMILMSMLFLYFCIGIASCRSPLKTLMALLKAPIFLGWKLVIFLASMCTLRKNRWVKTDRHLSS